MKAWARVFDKYCVSNVSKIAKIIKIDVRIVLYIHNIKTYDANGGTNIGKLKLGFIEVVHSIIKGNIREKFKKIISKPGKLVLVCFTVIIFESVIVPLFEI